MYEYNNIDSAGGGGHENEDTDYAADVIVFGKQDWNKVKYNVHYRCSISISKREN